MGSNPSRKSVTRVEKQCRATVSGPCGVRVIKRRYASTPVVRQNSSMQVRGSDGRLGAPCLFVLLGGLCCAPGLVGRTERTTIPAGRTIERKHLGLASCCRLEPSAPVLQLGEQPQDLKVQPYQGHEQSKGRVPLHVFRRATFGALFDEIEIQHQVEGRNDNDEDAEEDAKGAAGMNQGDIDSEEPQHEARELYEPDPTGGSKDAELEIFGGLNEAAAVGEQ